MKVSIRALNVPRPCIQPFKRYPTNTYSRFRQSYHVNFAVLQRIYIGQLRSKLVRQAVDLRFKARQPPGWSETLQQYSGCPLLHPSATCAQ